jgi:hypothetical protein
MPVTTTTSGSLAGAALDVAWAKLTDGANSVTAKHAALPDSTQLNDLRFMTISLPFSLIVFISLR